MLARPAIVFSICVLISGGASADGLQDNIPSKVRRIPRTGISVPMHRRAELEAGLASLAESIERIRATDALPHQLLPDVEIFHRAVRDALNFQEFFKESETDDALRLLELGQQRAASLLAGRAPWTQSTGLVVRGYVSKIDHSVQPYGLVIPQSYSQSAPRHRLDVWFHGRGETLSENNFLTQRLKSPGTFAPGDTIVLHPYGRYSNAFKFAGEVDVLEAIDAVRAQYRIDDDRTSVRGFSMGGAACWQFAVHYADRWFAANPGAGFSETPLFLDFFQKETLNPTWFERKLWRMYDCNLWAENLMHCPTVAYSGENDIQKQAADVMADALREGGVELLHVIGPGTGHKYHPDSHRTVTMAMDQLARRGRLNVPRTVRLKTYTLKYNRMHWLRVDGLEEHWEPSLTSARVDPSQSIIDIKTQGTTDLSLNFDSGEAPLDLDAVVTIQVNGRSVGQVRPRSDLSLRTYLYQEGGQWKLGERPEVGLRKQHNLQGPIDDALMDSFIFVRPTGKAWHESVGKWTESELERAIEHWRRHFRGPARVKDDAEVSETDIATANLILWGDPASNRLLARLQKDLPIRWTEAQVRCGDTAYPSQHHGVIAIYPNPLNPERYVVLNSSFTFREYAYLNNARQVPKLPDWAVIDVRVPADTLWPGKVVAADFFDERWQLK